MKFDKLNSSCNFPLVSDLALIVDNESDDPIVLIVFIALNALAAPIAVASNLAIIYTIATTPSLRTPSNILILGLAVSDFLVGLVSQPAYCISLFSRLKTDFGIFCLSTPVQQLTSWIFAVMSFLTLTVITTDRFLAIHLHLRYHELITAKRYMKVLVVVLITGTCAGAIRSFASDFLDKIVFAAVVPLVVLLLLNGFFLFRISRVIHKHSVQIQAQQQSVQQPLDMPRYKKSVNTMYFVVGAFILCYVPYSVMLVKKAIDPNDLNSNVLRVVAVSLVLFSGVLNPIIYFWRIQELRHGVLRALTLHKVVHVQEN